MAASWKDSDGAATAETVEPLQDCTPGPCRFPDDDNVSNACLQVQLAALQEDMKTVLQLLGDEGQPGPFISGASELLPLESVLNPANRLPTVMTTRCQESKSEAMQEPTLSHEWRSQDQQEQAARKSTHSMSAAIAAAQNEPILIRSSSGGSGLSSVGHNQSQKRAQTVIFLSDSKPELPFLQRLTTDGRFEAVVFFFVILNAIAIGFQADWEAQHGGANMEEGGWIFQALNASFTFVFIIEISLRIAAQKWDFFCGPGLGWNYLDLAIVFSSTLELVSLIMTVFNLSQFRILRLIRITKLMRAIRVARIVRYVRALRIMVHQLMSTIRALLWALLLLSLIVYVFAILMTQSVAGSLEDSGGEEFPSSLLLGRYWSSVPKSMFTMFQAVTGGIDWEDALIPLSYSGYFAPAIFVIYICFTQFAVLNVLTGVFCQSAIESAGHDVELQAQNMLENKHLYVQKVKGFFRDLGVDDSGVICATELKERLKDVKVQAYFETLDLDLTDLNAVMMLMDLEPGSIVNVEEFVDGCLRLKGSASNLSIAKLSRSQEVIKKRLENMSNSMKEHKEVITSLLVPLLQHTPRVKAVSPSSPCFASGGPEAEPESTVDGECLSTPPAMERPSRGEIVTLG